MKHKKLIAALLLTLFTTPLLTPLSMAKGASSIRVSTPRVSSPVRSSTPKVNTTTGKFFKSSNPAPTQNTSDSSSSFFMPFLTGYIIGNTINKSDKEKVDTQKEEPKLEAPKEEIKNPDGPGFFESIILWFKSLFE